MKRTALVIALVLIAAAFAGSLRSAAQQSPPLPTPFDILGHLEKFTLDNPTATDPLQGAKMVVNGIEVIIPRNTIINFPAAILTPKDIFDLASKGTIQGNNDGTCAPNPGNATTNASGLALTDCLPPTQNITGEQQHHPYAAYEVSITGNIKGGLYIAGLVSISQQSLNGSNGIIQTAVDGVITLRNAITIRGGPAVSRVKINATSDIYGKKTSAIDIDDPALEQDGRFSADITNATIHTETGYPMCIPSSTNPGLCPAVNRFPASPNQFVMCSTCDAPQSESTRRRMSRFPIWLQGKVCTGCNPAKPAPLLAGDYINFSGTLAKDANGFYISAHTMSSPVGIFTAPGELNSYIAIDLSIYGTGGEPFVDKGAVLSQENSPRGLKFEGFSTDPFATIDIYAIDRNATTGAKSLRYLMFVPPDPAVLGRFRHGIDKSHALPPPREILAVNRAVAATHGLIAPSFAATRTPLTRFGCSTSTPIVAGSNLEKWIDGELTATPTIPFGVYTSPLSEYIFPEGRNVGDTLPPYNFDDMDFLLNGFGPLDTRGRSAGAPIVGKLAPWPDVDGFVSFTSTTGTLPGCAGIGGGASNANCRRLSAKQCPLPPGP